MKDDLMRLKEEIENRFDLDAVAAACLAFDYEEVQGESAVKSMLSYIDYENTKGKPERIKGTMAHDLNGMRDSCFCPRSSSY